MKIKQYLDYFQTPYIHCWEFALSHQGYMGIQMFSQEKIIAIYFPPQNSPYFWQFCNVRCFVFNFWPQYILKFPRIRSQNMCSPAARLSSSGGSTVSVSSTCPCKSQPSPTKSASMSTMTSSHPDWAHWEDGTGRAAKKHELYGHYSPQPQCSALEECEHAFNLRA